MRLGGGILVVVACLVLGVSASQANPGDLDPTFDVDGLVTTDFGSTNDEAYSLAIVSGVKALAAGQTDDPTTHKFDFGLVRYNQNGSVDTTFGSSGFVRTVFSPRVNSVALAVIRLPTLNYVAAGYSGTAFALARYKPTGALDPTFNGTGKQTTSFSGGSATAFAVLRQPNARFVAAGTAHGEFALARYKPTGGLDTSFGVGGRVVTPFGPNDDEAQAILRQPTDGKLIAAGFSFGNSGADFALARYMPNGTLDGSFGVGGKVKTDFGANDRGLDAVLQSDGKIVVVGESSGQFALARYMPNGSLDGSFGAGGKVLTNFGDLARATGVAIQPNGDIVAGGTLFASEKQFLVARYLPGGTLDPGFGIGGIAKADFGSGFTEGESLKLQPDGKIVMAGHHGASLTTEDYALARWGGGDAPPPPPPPLPQPPPPPPPPPPPTTPQPSISIDDLSQLEGTARPTIAAPPPTHFVLTVHLSSPAGPDGVKVDFATKDGTATSPSDYAAKSGTVSFGAGDTSQQITIDVVADSTPEHDETFNVMLSNPVNATIADGTAVVTIQNDDSS